MKSLWQNWWKLMLSASEIALTAPQVMQARTRRLMTAPPFGSARQRREAARMVSEKWDAGVAGQIALWQSGWQLHQRLVEDIWSMAGGQRSPRRTARRAVRRAMQAPVLMAHRSLAPTQKRVRSNARRLRTRSS
jgi:hypothetical protein